jgi:enamine deaminase RidA (YjgF/YER057c/UK114 family)
MSFEILNPDSLDPPRGWSHGMLAPAGGRVLFVAGQIGTPGDGTKPSLVDQFGVALDRVLEVVRAAGGAPADVGRMTVYVTDLAAYVAGRPALREVWRARFGVHYPAMALVEVKGLVDPHAVVEIEATAVVGGSR